ncbi:VOC family protein [Agathobaculum sp. LCP25S3_E8]|uniref:VOC family protein n=1 Tax=Agathobaculum sp. LCP25S3_E8 TaxID=3438735 RepID=UPI003F8F6D2C
MLQYRLPVLAVRNIEISKKFYHDLFDQTVALDLGQSVTFSGGFAIQEDFDQLVDIPKCTILHQSNNMELYFEVDDFDAFLEKLRDFLDVELVHPPKMQEWHQRVVRLYDPDWHMVEVGESMEVVARRLLCEGYDVLQTAQIIQHPVEFVEQCRKGME